MDYGESPVDLPADEADDEGYYGEGYDREGGLLWSTATIVIASLILLLTNAVSLSDWAEDMPPSDAQSQAAEVAANWRDTTDQIGLAAPRNALHDVWKRAEAARFPE